MFSFGVFCGNDASRSDHCGHWREIQHHCRRADGRQDQRPDRSQTGVYKETLVWPAIHGISLVAEQGPDKTTIEGDGRRSVIHIEGKLKWDTIIEGFTIKGGGAGYERGCFGAGLNIVNASPTIRNCRITENTARPYRGTGGVFLWNSRAILEHNEIVKNHYQAERLHGGGVCVWGGMPWLRFNRIENNAGEEPSYFTRGGGVRLQGSQARVVGNVIQGNIATSVGAALYCGQSDKSCIFANEIVQNRSLGPSAGAVAVEPNSFPLIGGERSTEPNAIHDNMQIWGAAEKKEEKLRNLSPHFLGTLNQAFGANDWGGMDEESLGKQLENIAQRPKAAAKLQSPTDAGIK
ncbi:MAG: right-handed parallel beta-helix repeat-containing protein [Planctomycetota bacterium]